MAKREHDDIDNTRRNMRKNENAGEKSTKVDEKTAPVAPSSLELMAKPYEIIVNTMAGDEIVLKDKIFGWTCLSQVRILALQDLQKLASCKDSKLGHSWEYDIVHKGIVLPSRRQDFATQKHYVFKYLDQQDRLTLIRTRLGSM